MFHPLALNMTDGIVLNPACVPGRRSLPQWRPYRHCLMLVPMLVPVPRFRPRKSMPNGRMTWKLLLKINKFGWHILFFYKFVISDPLIVLSGISTMGSRSARARAPPPAATHTTH